jgi:alpha-ribazole phosphatase
VSRLVLVRHAEPDEDARGRCYGSLDVGLSGAGREHAQRLAASLVALAPVAVCTSPRRRARETAAPLAAACGLSLGVDDDLREIDFGDFEGRTYEEIERTEPELFRMWMETPTRVRFPGGESYADLKVRATRAIDRVRSAHPGGAAVIVTHGGPIRAALAAWLDLPDESIFRIDQRYCGVTLVDFLDGTPLVRLVNGEL